MRLVALSWGVIVCCALQLVLMLVVDGWRFELELKGQTFAEVWAPHRLPLIVAAVFGAIQLVHFFGLVWAGLRTPGAALAEAQELAPVVRLYLEACDSS